MPLIDGADDYRAAEMPLPVCPDGSPYNDLPPEEEEMPGASPLDDGLRRLEGMLEEGCETQAVGHGGTP